MAICSNFTRLFQIPELDPFGNVPNADEPLPTLERERIVVTKFIYDDDIEQLPVRSARKKKS